MIVNIRIEASKWFINFSSSFIYQRKICCVQLENMQALTMDIHEIVLVLDYTLKRRCFVG